MIRPLSILALASVATLVACKQDAPTTTAASASASTSAKPAQTMAAMPSASTSASAAPAAADHVALARAWVEAIAHGDSSKSMPKLGSKLAAALDASKIDDAWKTASKGSAFVSILSTKTITAPDHEAVTVTVKLDKGTIDVRVTFDPATHEVVGLHTSELDSWTAPEYVDATKFDERDVSVGDGAKALPGTLAMPKGDGPFPAVFLVHGSGPNDRDESTPGGAKLFRDLARGLASKGIAVLRYEKRTYGHYAALGVDPKNGTLKEEYLDDVAAASALLRATPNVDPKRVFVAGHSEGGYLVPKFLANDPALAGGVILSGNARKFFDLLLPQYTYLAKFTPDQAGAKAAIDDLKKQLAKARDPKLSLDTPSTDLPLGLNAAYVIDVRDYDPIATVKPETRPLFVLQGERDYQVTPADDFALWQKALAGRANAKTKLYPKLNHDYFAGEGEISPEEYMTKSGHVPAEVIDDLAAFLTAK